MEIFESIGLTHFWGLSPAIDVLDGVEIEKMESKEINVLISGSSDIRHILKTCADHVRDNHIENYKINFYVHERQKEILCRDILFFHILNCKHLNYRERLELFFDLFANSLVRVKSAQFLDCIYRDLITLISDPTSHKTALKDLFIFKCLKSKHLDDMTDIFNSWNSKVEFPIEKYRDDRLRFHYKQRYDFRTNLVDWDYQMELKEKAPIIHYILYRDWRQTGVAFETRQSTYIVPNRTLSSYVPGRRKVTRQSCMVRGYWGDIIISPYIAFGVETDYSPEKRDLFKVLNMQQVSHCVEVSDFNLQYYLKMLDKQEEHRQKQISTEIDLEAMNKLAQQQVNSMLNKDGKNQEQGEKKLGLDVIEEEKKDATQKKELNKMDAAGKETLNESQFTFDSLLSGFKKMNIKIIPICEDIQKLAQKKRFQHCFDIGVVGFIHSNYFTEDLFYNLFKNKAVFYAEKTDFLVPLKKVDKQALNEKLKNILKERKLDESIWFEKPDHFRFERNQNEQLNVQQIDTQLGVQISNENNQMIK